VEHRIVITTNAAEDFKSLDARQRATVQDALKVHLTHEPTKESKSRIKRLKDITTPQYRLRVDDLRVFYSVIGTDVIVQGIVSKEGVNQWLKERGKK
jgi:mRNA-degrading endonuclease RelE of RelBE toxin-antitoxin system